MARKAAWEELAEADLGPYSKSSGTRWGRVLTVLLLIAAATFVAAYYLPLFKAHQKLGEQFAELGRRAQTLADDAGKTQRELKAATETRDRLQAEHDQTQQGVKASADQLERARGLLAPKLDKLVKKDSAALLTSGGALLVALDSAALFPAQKIELSPAGRALLCDVSKTSGAKAIDVRAVLPESSPVPPALIKIFPSPWAFSAARAAAAATALEACAPGVRLSATGSGKQDTFSEQLASSKLPAERLELALSLQ